MSSSKIMSSMSSSAAENSISDVSLLDAQIALLDASASVVVDPNTSSSSRTVDDVWREIVSGDKKDQFCLKEETPDAMMTLEDFLLAKTGIGGDDDDEEEDGGDVDVKGFPFPAPVSGGMGEVSGSGKRGRGMLEPLDKAAQQRQRRMIKNRESAARSRERKQAYQVELESLAVRLEEEHASLLKDKAERTKVRFKQLMEKVIPVEEKRRPRRVLRRVCSFEW